MTLKIKSSIAYCGKHVVISPGFFLEVPSSLVIEDNVSFGPHVGIYGAGKVIFKKNSMIANNVKIVTSTHDPSTEDMRFTGIHKDVIIEENAWIGAGAIILGGVTIGKDSIVGAGSLVNKNVEPFAVNVGVPAKPIRLNRMR
jgi:acetyltransferase-like isoleucine patch superfamily enzyme